MVVLLVIVFVLVRLNTTTSAPTAKQPSASKVVASITSIPPSELNQVGRGTPATGVKNIQGTPLTGSNGKPEVLWFAVSIPLAIVRLGLPASSPAWRLQLAWSIGGLAVVASLVYVEVVRLNSICLWCSGAHLLVLLSFVLGALVPAERRGQRRLVS